MAQELKNLSVRRLLHCTQLPLAHVAQDCGFSSQGHFTTTFTREVGISPGAFRKLAAMMAGGMLYAYDTMSVLLLVA